MFFIDVLKHSYLPVVVNSDFICSFICYRIVHSYGKISRAKQPSCIQHYGEYNCDSDFGATMFIVVKLKGTLVKRMELDWSKKNWVSIEHIYDR